MHAQGEVSLVLFSKLKQFLKICLENALVNCLTQSFLLTNTIFEVSECLDFLIFMEKPLLSSKMSSCLADLTISTF